MNIINVFTVTFDQFDASLQNKSISLCLQKKSKNTNLTDTRLLSLRYFYLIFSLKLKMKISYI